MKDFPEHDARGNERDRLPTFDVQTRSESGGLNFFPTMEEALAHSRTDLSVWKISCSLPTGERIRLVRTERDLWMYEPIFDAMVKVTLAGGVDAQSEWKRLALLILRTATSTLIWMPGSLHRALAIHGVKVTCGEVEDFLYQLREEGKVQEDCGAGVYRWKDGWEPPPDI